MRLALKRGSFHRLLAFDQRGMAAQPALSIFVSSHLPCLDQLVEAGAADAQLVGCFLGSIGEPGGWLGHDFLLSGFV